MELKIDDMSVEELEQALNGAEGGNAVELVGEMTVCERRQKSFLVGNRACRSLLTLRRPNLLIDGRNARIRFETESAPENDLNLLYLTKAARNTQLQNLRIVFEHRGGDSGACVRAIANSAYGLIAEHCSIEMTSDSQLSMTGIYNDGNLDTTLETPADCLRLNGNRIRIRCLPDQTDREINVCCVSNRLSNSAEISGNDLTAVVSGSGERQRAVGIFNSGRYVRIIDNNVKANGSHSAGRQLEQAHTCALENHGDFLICTGNNLVGEWGGQCTGAYNEGLNAVFSANKILATHTIKGRALENAGAGSNIQANMIVSTSRNARLLLNRADGVLIGGNALQVLMAAEECRSGCGILLENIQSCLIAGNRISGAHSCGIFLKHSGPVLEHNLIERTEGLLFREVADLQDHAIAAALDERRICSIE